MMIDDRSIYASAIDSGVEGSTAGIKTVFSASLIIPNFLKICVGNGPISESVVIISIMNVRINDGPSSSYDHSS